MQYSWKHHGKHGFGVEMYIDQMDWLKSDTG